MTSCDTVYNCSLFLTSDVPFSGSSDITVFFVIFVKPYCRLEIAQVYLNTDAVYDKSSTGVVFSGE